MLRIGFLILGLACLAGCFLDSVIGPGYFVSLAVKDAGCTQTTGFGGFEELAVSEGFRKIHSQEDTNFYVLYYRRNLSSEEIRKFHYRFVNIGLTCDYRNKSLGVEVMNDWEGQQIAAKMEIDRLSDRYVDLLEQQHGKGTVTDIRRRTGPPF